MEAEIKTVLDKLYSPITTIPSIDLRRGAMIIAEIGDFNNFSSLGSPDKILAFAGLSPPTYQSDQLNNCYAHMEKRGTRYLRYALFNATKFVCNWNPVFAHYLTKKCFKGKHYNIAISLTAKKLVRLIFAMQNPGRLILPMPNFDSFNFQRL